MLPLNLFDFFFISSTFHPLRSIKHQLSYFFQQVHCVVGDIFRHCLLCDRFGFNIMMASRRSERVLKLLVLIALFVLAFIQVLDIIISNYNRRSLYTFHEKVDSPERSQKEFDTHMQREEDNNEFQSISEQQGQDKIELEETTPMNAESVSINFGTRMASENDQDPVPIMHTFFEADEKGYCCGMLNSGHEMLLNAWEQAWQNRGWRTKILTLEDAKLHPEFEIYQDKLKKIGLTEYNQKCYWRWFAMAAIQDGGFMADYDSFPLELDGKKGLELERAPDSGTFTSYSNHVPCLIHASREEWDRILHLMLDSLPEDHGTTSTDMQSLVKIGHEIGVEEAGMIWKDETYRTFGYRRNQSNELEVDCDELKGMKIAHLSHKGTTDAYRSKLFPEIERELGPMNGRGEAARIFMNDYNAQCLKDNKIFLTRYEDSGSLYFT